MLRVLGELLADLHGRQTLRHGRRGYEVAETASSPRLGLHLTAARSPEPAHEDRHDRDEIDLPEQRLQHRERSSQAGRGREIAVADGREGDEAEVEIVGTRRLAVL